MCYEAMKKDLHMIFIDLEKAYVKVPWDVLWWAMSKKGIPCKHIDFVDIYLDRETNVSICGEVMEESQLRGDYLCNNNKWNSTSMMIYCSVCY